MELPIKALLVPLDGSKNAERALEPAVRLAKLSGASLTLFHWDFDPQEGALTGSYLEMLAEGLEVPADVEVVINEELAGSIAKAALDRSAIVVMATQGRTGVARAVLGSVAEEVLATVRQPTVLVGPHIEPLADQPVGKIVACLDGSSLAEVALKVTTAWAQQLGAPIELVHAIEPANVAGFPESSADIVDSGYLARIAKSMEVTERPSFDVLHGPAAAAIADHAEHGVELVAMATHGRTGISRLALGSVAMGVAHRASRPVLVVPSAADPA